MAQNRSLFLEGLERAESRKDGGFKQFKDWSFSVSEESEDDQDHNCKGVRMEQSDRQTSSSPEDTKPYLCLFSSSSCSSFVPMRCTDSPMPNRTNFVIIGPAPSQGIVIQGRHFQHTQMPSHARRPLTRDFPSTQPPVEMDSIVLTCSDVSEEEHLNVKRRLTPRRQPLQDCRTFPSPAGSSWPSPYPLICLNCKKPKEPSEKCSNCGSLGPASTPTPRPPIRLTPAQPQTQTQAQTRTQTGPLQGLQPAQGFYRPVQAVPVRVTRTHNCKSDSKLNDPIVLSSDEEEDVADNASTGSSRVENISPRPADSAHSSPAPSGGKVEEVKSAVEQEEPGPEFFEDVNVKISIPRRARMKDQFTTEHIQLDTEGPEGQSESVIFRASELLSCDWCSVRKLPVLFFQSSEQECERLREELQMSRSTGGDWIDCSSTHPDEKYIVLIFENGLPMEQQVILEDILGEIGQNNNLSDFPSKISFDEANLRLVNYNKATERKDDKVKSPVQSKPSPVSRPSPVSLRTRMSTRQKPNDFESDDEMMDLQPTFTGPIIKRSPDQSSSTTFICLNYLYLNKLNLQQTFTGPIIAKYEIYLFKQTIYISSACSDVHRTHHQIDGLPSSSGQGGISVTNEDLHCLNDGEFLNDVIIDFYLKYLVLEKLKKEDSQRIHVFSSFFYKRLNQRERRNGPDPSNLPLPKKKHNRVKTWTRHVDLFQKDFIFVPINESAHWYLAVICFPGLERPLLEPNPQFQGESVEPQTEEPIPDHCRPLSPSPSPEAEETEETGETGEVEAEVEEKNQQNSPEQSFNSELHRISVSYGSGSKDEILSLSQTTTAPARTSAAKMEL
ncbi:hypothetical protein WMY93_032200 [Mugilogobius chulae]|uniref:Ubiquitin-like protease family profile domain-containing protein n=1 Tax=Mugilogobius chulae TaxID=88201 RepID=A0AAW0MJY9_9GOBI